MSETYIHERRSCRRQKGYIDVNEGLLYNCCAVEIVIRIAQGRMMMVLL